MKCAIQFSPLPITASRAVRLGNSVATVGFPNIGLQGFAPKFARGEIAALSGAGDDARYFQSLSRRPPFRCSREIPAARWWMSAATSLAWFSARRPPCEGGVLIERCVAGKCELRGEEQFPSQLPRIGARNFRQTQRSLCRRPHSQIR